MAILNSQVSALLQLGADAMDNLFDVDINPPAAVSAVEPTGRSPFTLRCLGFAPPKFTLSTYDIPYKTRKIKRSAGRIDGDRSFQLQFRLDAYYIVYRLLLAWRSAQMQPATGFAGSALNVEDSNHKSFLGGSIFVTAADSPVYRSLTNKYAQAPGITSGEVGGTGSTASLNWSFEDVWVIDVDNPKFIAGSGEVQIISATFGFGSYMEPQLYDSLYGTAASPAASSSSSVPRTYQNIIPAQI